MNPPRFGSPRDRPSPAKERSRARRQTLEPSATLAAAAEASRRTELSARGVRRDRSAPLGPPHCLRLGPFAASERDGGVQRNRVGGERRDPRAFAVPRAHLVRRCVRAPGGHRRQPRAPTGDACSAFGHLGAGLGARARHERAHGSGWSTPGQTRVVGDRRVARGATAPPHLPRLPPRALSPLRPVRSLYPCRRWRKTPRALSMSPTDVRGRRWRVLPRFRGLPTRGIHLPTATLWTGRRSGGEGGRPSARPHRLLGPTEPPMNRRTQ